MNTKALFLSVAGILALACLPPMEVRAAGDAANLVIVRERDSGPRVALAAAELRRYVYLRTGSLGKIADAAPASRDRIVLARDGALAPEQYAIRTDTRAGRQQVTITGGAGLGILYGAYRYIEKLGVRFYLHGDVIPDDRITLLPEVNEDGKPLFDIRGIQPFHDFPEGPDWWNRDDYLAYISQLPKMRMNFIGLHCYPEGGVGPEALVWIGQKADCDAQGRVSFSYPSFWANTAKDMWGCTAAKTSEFAGGASMLFPADDYGNEVQAGLMPWPRMLPECNELFNRTAVMMRGVFAHAKALGVKTCIGTETPLTIPKAVREHLQSQGKTDPAATVRELYEGMFARIQRAYPVDYYWLWTPEGWTWGGNNPKAFEETTRDIQAALGALGDLGQPFTLATCGWVLGPQHDRAALDAFLPKDSPMSCINRQVGHDAVEPSFANITGRPKWAIPWMENDPALTQPQPWVGRMRYDAADAKRLGCTGLLGIHWRTKAMMQNVAALASASWDQAWVPASYDTTPAKPQPPGEGADDGAVAAFTDPVGDTDEAPVYQNVRYNLKGYSLTVPDGAYTVVLKFNEPAYDQAGKRVFGVALQGKQVIEGLDIFAKAGKNHALDFTFSDIAVTNGALRIAFTPQVEFPCIAGIVIDGKTKAGNQLPARPFTRKINCGGGTFKDYEADRVAGAVATAGRDRAMPVADFYEDFARASFGDSVAAEAGTIMAGVDGVKMPETTTWITGPGCIKANDAPWEQVKPQFAFVETFAKLRPQLRGAGNLERFDYWLNTYRAAESIARLGCLRHELDLAVKAMKDAQDTPRKKKLAADALAVRETMARAWEKLMSYQTAAADTPGELGTIANLELQNRRTRHIYNAYDKDIADVLGAPLPAAATPSSHFDGAPRLIVPTVRTQVAPGEQLSLRVIALGAALPRTAVLHWRKLGSGRYQAVPLQHVARGVYSVTLPPAKEDLEYYVEATLADSSPLRWPATAPRLNQTVIVE